MGPSGSGKSTPAGELGENTADHLVADFEQLREMLGIDTWHVFGGSWGSTLGIYYAQECPDRVRSLLLRGIWLFRDSDIPRDERDDLLEAYWTRFHSDDTTVAQEAARAWSVYEGSCCTLLPNAEFADAFAEDEMSWNLARLEAHYMRNARFPPGRQLLERVDRIRDIPAFAVHGRYDIVCPACNLHDLKSAWPELDAQFVADAGHSSHEPGITRELVAATQRIAQSGSPLR